MEQISLIADIVGILGAVFALLAWVQAGQINKKIEQEQRRQNKRINVILRNGMQPLELPIELRRAELTRAEILGRIGMIPMKEKGKRFSLGYLNTPEFLRRINELTEGHRDSVLEIPCTEEELNQFDYRKMQ
jgi:hypothetical protein